MKSSSFFLSHLFWTAMVVLVPVLLWAEIPEGYYDTAENLTGSELKAALHDIVSDHIKYPYTSSSTDVWDILKDTDEDPDNSDNVILLYTGRSQAKTENSGESSASGSNRWNREHVWSKSHGFPSENDTAYTDCHHIRPADESVNSSRSTLDFDNGGNQHVEAVECYYDGDSWEPRDAVKGDVARMMFYMVVRYDPGYHTDNSVYDLELVDYTGTQTYESLFGKLSTLLQWHNQDPVDDFEARRNEIVYGYQGNRNPFIDHPEWVDSIFSSQLAPHTRIGFTDNSIAVDESDGSINLELSIINPDPNLATQCTISLSGGSGEAADLAGFTEADLTFPAGSSALQTLEITLTDDEVAEDQETFIFSISNVSGGDSATVNGNDSFVLTINSNDQISAVSGLIISEVMDGNRSGGSPKFLEITNTTSETMDISGFQIWRGSNGNDPESIVVISGGTMLGSAESWVIAQNAGDMLAAGYPEPDQSAWGINGNGNDVYQLRSSEGAYIDAFGLVGTSSYWYENSVAVRVTTVSSGRASFEPEEWLITSLESGLPANGTPGTPGTHNFEVVAVDQVNLPPAFTLLKPYPNPFNPAVRIGYTLPEPAEVSIIIYNMNGREIRNLVHAAQRAGTQEVIWKGENNAGLQTNTGVYFCRFTAGSYQQTIKLIYLR